MSEPNEDNLLGEDLGEYDLLNEDEEALLADDYREEQREYEDVLDIGVTEDGLEDDLDNENCDIGGSMVKGDLNNSSYLEINASNNEDFSSSHIQSPETSINKQASSINNVQIEEEDEEEEAEREARERFRSERKSSTNSATFRSIPDSLDKVVSNPLPAVRQNTQQRQGRGFWRMRGNRNGGLINRPGPPRMPGRVGRGFIHQRQPFISNRFPQPGVYSQHNPPRPRGMWGPPSNQQPPLGSMPPSQRFPPTQNPQQPQHHLSQNLQHQQMNNQTSRKILINPHFRGAVQPHSNARLVWDNNGPSSSINSEMPHSSNSLLSMPPSTVDSHNPVNVQHHHYTQQQHISSHQQQSGVPMYEHNPGPLQPPPQQQSYPNYHTQGSHPHHVQDTQNFQQHPRMTHPTNLPPRVPQVNSGNWISKPHNETGYRGHINSIENPPQTHQQMNQTNQTHYYNDLQNSAAIDMNNSNHWASQRDNVLNPDFSDAPPHLPVTQYSHHSINTPAPSRQVMFSGDVSVDNSLPLSSTSLLNEQIGSSQIYSQHTQHQRTHLRTSELPYSQNQSRPHFASQGPRKMNSNLNMNTPQRIVVYQQPLHTEINHQQRRPLQNQPQEIHPNQLTSNTNSNMKNNPRRIIQTKTPIRKQVSVHSTQQPQRQNQRQVNNSPIKRSLIPGEVTPRNTTQKRIKMRQGDIHTNNTFISKRKPDMSNLHEVKTVDTLYFTTPDPDTTTSASGEDSEQKDEREKSIREEEDEEAIEYRRKIEQQKKLREQILQQKEARRKKAALEKQRQLGIINSSSSTSITSSATTTTSSTPQFKSEHVQGNAIATIVNRNTIEPIMSSSTNTNIQQNKPKRSIFTKTPLLKTPPNITTSSIPTNIRPNRTVVLRGTTPNSNTPNNLIDNNPSKIVQNRVVKTSSSSSFPDASKLTGTANVTSSIVAIENLAASTSEIQLRQMCQSVGHIKELRMIPQERRALVTFTNPSSANIFFKRYQRKIVDLSLINLTLVS